MKKSLSLIALLVAVSACQHDQPVRSWNSPEGSQTATEQMPNEEGFPVEQSSVANMHPSVMGDPVGTYKIGKPYVVDGMNYTPAEESNYQAEGMSSWYGSEFAGQKTANGAIFNPQSYTAAHKTLPLPSVVKITNLENGRTTYARVNDRGPFTKNRLMDVSEAVATELQMKANGTARIKVEVMPVESAELKNRAMQNTTQTEFTTTQPTGLAPSEMMPQPVATNGYYVQAGALASMANAETMRGQLSSVGATSIVQEGGYYKVRVGPYQTVDQARQAKDSLQSHGISNPGLISDGKWSKW
ncbi:MAG: septal ring lytic transglycosylase RlpA family protein [Alphaproteobacteria bacterium]|nr:septal ring lytic transglycosylase RlpA family protein [Alphaproteobacteria bacterium]